MFACHIPGRFSVGEHRFLGNPFRAAFSHVIDTQGFDGGFCEQRVVLQ
jgi:hypothetical protein